MMHTSLRVLTRAKVNLHLEILRRRRDGYHEIETILQTVDLADTLDITIEESPRVTISCTQAGIPTGEDNLCYRAMTAMQEVAGRPVGGRIHIDKVIPAGAGLGGGSANAAGVMIAVDRALGLKTPFERLEEIGATLGSDVPFMLRGGTAIGRGRGEKITPLEPIKGGTFVIVKPQINISTAWAYEHYSFRLTRPGRHLNLKAVNAVLARVPGGSLSFRNALEDVVCPSHPIIAGALDELISLHPSFASMTGSGSALFALFDRRERALEAAERFSVRGFFTSVVGPARRAVEVVQ